jgi:hypothetical protein
LWLHWTYATTKKPGDRTPSSAIRSKAGGAGDPCPVCNVAEPPALPDDFIRDIEADALYAALDDFARKVKVPPH